MVKQLSKSAQKKIEAIRAKAKAIVEPLLAGSIQVSAVGVDVEKLQVGDCIKQPLMRFYEDESHEPDAVVYGEESHGDEGRDKKLGTYEVRHPEQGERGCNEIHFNTVWPIADFDESDVPEAVQKLEAARVALCIVQGDEVPGELALALTGGGMDMSADIIRAYVAIGQLPPARLRMPGFAGEKYDLDNAVAVEALRKSRDVLRGWMTSDDRDLDHVEQKMVETGVGK